MIPKDHIAPRADIAQLEVVPRQHIAHLSQRQEPALDNQVQAFLDDLAMGNALRRIVRLEVDLIQGVPQQRRQTFSGPLFDPGRRGMQQSRQAGALHGPQSRRGQSPGRRSQMPAHQHIALMRQRPPQRPFSQRPDPFQCIDDEHIPLEIDTDGLQVVQQACVRVPEPLPRKRQQRP